MKTIKITIALLAIMGGFILNQSVYAQKVGYVCDQSSDRTCRIGDITSKGDAEKISIPVKP
ncbi:hypothetical protein HX004_09065 [Myroides sp. 1354]|uniref:hypothetical protein n=1 Tax=unclassified Myroides TaxID=2642485 RepID=UPI0025790F80|nr:MULTISPECIES: hypothetical protein [unclassified Myroides]MDM1045041.1 hypothetical protein [Myroides sp. R163-1]MDM1055923.1 hypothetical protein [Myroides sp. 1354]MDM1069128.1 hypothetical protein [Myroides sp. 1372]